jgi:hypothetical protein
VLTDLADPALSPNCVPMNSQRVILSGAVKPPGSFCAYVHPGVVIRVGYPQGRSNLHKYIPEFRNKCQS